MSFPGFPGASGGLARPFPEPCAAFPGSQDLELPCSASRELANTCALQSLRGCSFAFPLPFPRLLAIMFALLKPFPAAAFPFPGLSRLSRAPFPEFFLIQPFPAFPQIFLDDFLELLYYFKNIESGLLGFTNSFDNVIGCGIFKRTFSNEVFCLVNSLIALETRFFEILL